MTSIIRPVPQLWNDAKNMAVKKDVSDEVLNNIWSKLKELNKPNDDVDNPHYDRSISDETEFDKLLFETMKFEVNRLNSFDGKWPLSYVKPKELAEAGFFYLQSEDKVQCTFCRTIIDDWNVGDKPLKEHMKKSPKCRFLMTANVGNVPISPSKRTAVPAVKVAGPVLPTSNKPKHPRMTDIRNRMRTYVNWPLMTLSSKVLAECGLYYTGVADVVTCFFCGGSLGNWELNDDPWTEHFKFFPSCAYIALAKRHGKLTPESALDRQPQHLNIASSAMSSTSFQNFGSSDAIRQACEIFSKQLVEQVISKRNRPFSSLQEICEAVFELKENERRNSSSNTMAKTTLQPNSGTTLKTDSSAEVRDVLLCKICMDRERGVVFQPCGHLVSCTNCAQQIVFCPMCRVPITNKVRTFLS